MNKKIFLNNDVSRIVGITQRQVLGWSEKGLVIPHLEATGAGNKRNYDYANLLEFGLCRVLFLVGMGIQTIKKILGELRRVNVIRAWSDDFSAYYQERFETLRDHYLSIKNTFDNPINETTEKAIIEGPPPKPKDPEGVLLYYFNNEGEQVKIIPWDMNYVVNLSIIEETLSQSVFFIAVDLGKIKKGIDKNL